MVIYSGSNNLLLHVVKVRHEVPYSIYIYIGYTLLALDSDTGTSDGPSIAASEDSPSNAVLRALRPS